MGVHTASNKAPNVIRAEKDALGSPPLSTDPLLTAFDQRMASRQRSGLGGKAPRYLHLRYYWGISGAKGSENTAQVAKSPNAV